MGLIICIGIMALMVALYGFACWYESKTRGWVVEEPTTDFLDWRKLR